MMEPGRIVHTFPEFDERHEILGPQVEFVVGPGEVEAAVRWQLSLSVLSAMAPAVAPRRLDHDAVCSTATAQPDDCLAFVENVPRDGGQWLIGELTELARPFGSIFAEDTQHVDGAESGARQRPRPHRDHNHPSERARDNII